MGDDEKVGDGEEEEKVEEVMGILSPSFNEIQ